MNNTTNPAVLLIFTDTCLSSNLLPSGCHDLLQSTEKRAVAAVPAPHPPGPHRAACCRCQTAVWAVLSWTSQLLASCDFHIHHLISPTSSAGRGGRERGSNLRWSSQLRESSEDRQKNAGSNLQTLKPSFGGCCSIFITSFAHSRLNSVPALAMRKVGG